MTATKFKAIHTDNEYTEQSGTGLVLSRSNSYIQSTADNSTTLNIGQSSVRWGHVKVDAADFAVLNGGNERMRVASSGKVGIGTSSPTQNLDVRGNAIIAGTTPGAPIGTAATLEVYESGSDAILAIHQDDSAASSAVAGIRLRNGGNDTCIKIPTSGQGLVIDTEGKSNALVLDINGKITSHVTASNNISSSGTVSANAFKVDNNTGLISKNIAGADRTFR
jgi:hypothetical protein